MRKKLAQYLPVLWIGIIFLIWTPQARAGGVVTVCNEAGLTSKTTGGGAVTFSCSGTITLSSTIVISAATTIDASGQTVTISGNNAVRIFSIANLQTLTLNNLTLADGRDSTGQGGAAIYNPSGFVTITNSTFSNNSATNGGAGGAILNGLALTITNSTFHGNSASAGGAIATVSNTLITNATFFNNSASSGGASISGGGVSLKNTLLAGASGSTECNGFITNDGFNLSADTSCGSISSVSLTSLKLVSPATNGGRTQTVGLEADSVARDVIPSGSNGCGSTVTGDQRGISRPQNGNCDVGAFEVVSNTVGNGTGASCTFTALNNAVTAYGGVVKFNCGASASIPVTSTITFTSATTVDGTGQAITLSGGNTARIFAVNANVPVTLKYLTLSNGSNSSGGGAIHNSGTLTLTNDTFSGNTASNGYGASIYNNGGTLTVSSSTFSGNNAHLGGAGIYSTSGVVTVSNSSFSANTGDFGGAGIYAGTGTLTVTGSAFSSNASASGGAYGAGIYTSTATLTITNSTFSANTANFGGGGIFNGGTGNFTNVTFFGNSQGSIYNAGDVTLKNTILAGGNGGQCSGNTIIDGGYNRSDDSSCSLSGTSSSVPLSSLRLRALSSNGGPTQTIALQAGSVAIDVIPAGDTGCTGGATDQRGFARPQHGSCDIGAYEAVVVGTGTNASCTPAELTSALALGGYVDFSCGVSATIAVTGGGSMNTDTTLDGTGSSITLNWSAGLFTGNNGATTSLNNLNITTLVQNISGTMTISNTTISATTANGGLTNNSGATLNLINSTVSANNGLTNSGTATVTHSTIYGNGTAGFGIRVFSGTLMLKNSLVANHGTAECSGTLSDGGYNRATDGTCLLSGTSTQNVSLASLNLRPLTLNGGVTQTVALGLGSIARDAIPNGQSGCGSTTTTDQRGMARPQNGSCDIGAYEVAFVGTGTSPSCTEQGLATAVSFGGTVGFNCGGAKEIPLTSALLVFGNVSLDGTGQSITLNGNLTHRLFTVIAGGSLSIDNMMLINGQPGAGTNLTGGAISNGGILVVSNATFSGNVAVTGGAIVNAGTLSITSSTFSGNTAAGAGGAIAHVGGTLSITSSTISGNSAPDGAGVYSGGGSTTVQNTILAGNTGGNQCSGTISTITDSGYNRSDDSSCSFSGTSQVVSLAGLRLGSLRSNGGLTKTIAVGSGSTAIDAIPNGASGCSSGTDQRGFARPYNGNCDIGAYEALFVGTGTNLSCSIGALNAALSLGGTIGFNCGSLVSLAVSSPITITSDITLDGSGPPIVLSSNNAATRLFIVNAGASLSINSLTLSGGRPSTNGGGIDNQGTLYITNSHFHANGAADGGAIRNSGTASVINSTFTANGSTANGGAISNTGTITITNSTFSGNTSSGSGGAIYRGGGTVMVEASIFTATGAGGACGGTIHHQGYNLSDDSSCGFSGTSQDNVSVSNLKLGTLGFNGGSTSTIPLNAGSVAIDAIPSGSNGCGTTVATDQRGNRRPQNSNCDIGAFELVLKRNGGQITSN